MVHERVEIGCDPDKRSRTLAERGLDFHDAVFVFAGETYTVEDDRKDYGEVRYQTYGRLGERMVMIVWTRRGDIHHVISMRYSHEWESRQVLERMGRSG